MEYGNATRWDTAMAEVKAVYITETPDHATGLASWYLQERVITVQDYVALKRWAEGRPSYARRLWADELVD